jgi:hypothetical protein
MRLFHEPGTESWKQLEALPLYCIPSNPGFFRTQLKPFEEMGS